MTTVFPLSALVMTASFSINLSLMPVATRFSGIFDVHWGREQGAGDAFIGALAFLLAYRPSWSLARKVQAACHVAAQSIMKRGTQGSFPQLSDLPSAWLSD